MVVSSIPAPPNPCTTAFRCERRRVPKNTLLARLPNDELARLAPYLEMTHLEFKQVLVEFDHAIEYVYFLESAVTSTIVRTPNGEILEVGRWTTICLYGMADQTFSQTVFR